jgi:hypothetical protein
MAGSGLGTGAESTVRSLPHIDQALTNCFSSSVLHVTQVSAAISIGNKLS